MDFASWGKVYGASPCSESKVEDELIDVADEYSSSGTSVGLGTCIGSGDGVRVTLDWPLVDSGVKAGLNRDCSDGSLS